MRIAICSSPRPETWKASGASVASTRMATLKRASRSSRSRSLREVTCCPSRPAIGESLTAKTMASVGSSTWMGGSGRGSSGSVTVSPIVTSSMPATATMSPAAASAISTRRRPS